MTNIELTYTIDKLPNIINNYFLYICSSYKLSNHGKIYLKTTYDWYAWSCSVFNVCRHIDYRYTTHINSCYKTEFISKYGKLIHKVFQKVSKQQKNVRLIFISKLWVEYSSDIFMNIRKIQWTKIIRTSQDIKTYVLEFT